MSARVVQAHDAAPQYRPPEGRAFRHLVFPRYGKLCCPNNHCYPKDVFFTEAAGIRCKKRVDGRECGILMLFIGGVRTKGGRLFGPLGIEVIASELLTMEQMHMSADEMLDYLGIGQASVTTCSEGGAK